ncbi:MAG: Ig-like domain-containing protein [Acidimicrobiales bacterium]
MTNFRFARVSMQAVGQRCGRVLAALAVAIGFVAAVSAAAPIATASSTSSPSSNPQGYWLVTRAGGVHAFGSTDPFGSKAGVKLAAAVVAVAATPDGRGYWLVTSAGAVYNFGDAKFYGSVTRSPSPVVAAASLPIEDTVLFQSDRGVILPKGHSYHFAARVVGPGGIPTDKSVVWTSSDAQTVSVSRTGLATANAALGSVTITASAPGAIADAGSVIIAQPAPGTVVLPSADVLSVKEGQVVLRETAATEKLTTGDRIVTGSQAGVLAAATSVRRGNDDIVVSTKPTSLTEAFSRLDVDVTGAPTLATLVASRDRRYSLVDKSAELLPRDDNSLECSASGGTDLSISLAAPSVSIPVTITPFVELQTRGLTVLDFELAVTILMPIQITTGSITASGSGTFSAHCLLSADDVEIPTPIVIGPVELDGSVSPSAGITMTGSVSASATIAGPTLTDTVTALNGIQYSGGQWSPIESNANSGVRVVPQGVTSAAGISATITPYVRIDAGFSAELFGWLDLATFNFAFAEADAPLSFALQSPFASTTKGYSGPAWSAQLLLSAGPEVDLTGPIAEILEALGVPPVSEQWSLYSSTTTLAGSPDPALTLSTKDLLSGSIDIDFVIPPGYLGDRLSLVGYPVVGGAGLILYSTKALNGDTNVTWSPGGEHNGSYLVGALLYDPIFGAVGLPYASSSEQSLTIAIPTGPGVPVNTALPVIQDSEGHSPPITGDTLQATPGSWTSSPTGYSFQWQDCNASASCTDILQATDDSYIVQVADSGFAIDVTVVASNVSGSSLPATSAPTKLVAAKSGPESVDPNNSLTSVSCVAGSTWCVAVDNAGNALYFDGTGWSQPDPIDTGTSLNSVSCASGTFCVAADSDGDVLTYDGSSWTTVSVGSALSDIACTSSSYCGALGGNDFFSFNGSDWSDDGSVTYYSATRSSCFDTDSCVVVSRTYIGVDMYYEDVSGDTLGNGVAIDVDGSNVVSGPTSLSCPSADFCAAGIGFNYSGTVLLDNDGTWNTLSVDGSNTISDLSCTSSSFCMAVDNGGNALDYDGTAWTPQLVDTTGTLNAISCGSADFCVAVDSSGGALVYSSGSWS